MSEIPLPSGYYTRVRPLTHPPLWNLQLLLLSQVSFHPLKPESFHFLNKTVETQRPVYSCEGQGMKRGREVDGQGGNSFYPSVDRTSYYRSEKQSTGKFLAGQPTHTQGLYILLPQLYKMSSEILVHFLNYKIYVHRGTYILPD